jgi:crotonobetainyl-CoA:carnitine CoA-transferase CaiB-like acyl-CoA transferase
MPAAFDDVRILDFSSGIAGPMACMLLADLGADVVKVEPLTGDRLAEHPGYLCWNRNKRCVVLDLDAETGLASARELLSTADAAVFDRPPDALVRAGLAPQAISERQPQLVCMSLPPYGEAPAWSRVPAAEGLLWAYAGGAFRQFSWEDVPVWLVTPQAEYGHAMLAAGALAAALLERERSGRGQLLTVTGLHAMAALQAGHLVQTGDVQKLPPRGARGRIANYRLYRCADGEWLFLATLIEAHFRRALEALEFTELMALDGVDDQFANVMRPGVARHVNRALEERFARKSRDEWLRALWAHGVPCAGVAVRDAWFASETVAQNELRVELEHPEHGRVSLPGVPVRLAETPGRVRHLPETVGPDDVVAERRAPSPSRRVASGAAPLSGITVLDLGVIIAGTYATAILADFGADVIKVEPPAGDPFRAYGLTFVGFNRGKRSVALDLRHAEGLETFLSMVRTADVVCDNYRLGVLERLGIDYPSLSRINPRLVQASVTAYGTRGALAQEPGFDPLLQAQSGLMAAQGGNDEPVFHQVAVHDTASAMIAAFGIVAALRARERTGRGQRVETSLAAQSVLCQSGELVAYAGRPPSPVGDRDCVGVSALQRFYRCDDGWIAVACADEAMAVSLCEALGHPEWPRLESPLAAPRGGDLAGRIAAELAGISRQAALERLAARGAPAVPALDHAEIYAHPLHEPARFFHESEHPAFGRVTAARSLAEWSRTPAGPPRRAPLLGEHGAEILAELGLSRARIAQLVDAGALRLPG